MSFASFIDYLFTGLAKTLNPQSMDAPMPTQRSVVGSTFPVASSMPLPHMAPREPSAL